MQKYEDKNFLKATRQGERLSTKKQLLDEQLT